MLLSRTAKDRKRVSALEAWLAGEIEADTPCSPSGSMGCCSRRRSGMQRRSVQCWEPASWRRIEAEEA